MPDQHFAEISDKLNAPKKVSLFERQRQEAETKRLREEAETRKALREFENSFAEDDDDDDPISHIASGRSAFTNDPPAGPRGAGTAGALGGPRHFPSSERLRNVGPGSLGPPPPSLKRKRELEERSERKQSGTTGEVGGFERRGSDRRSADVKRDLGILDDDEEDTSRKRRSPEPTVRKPTMLLEGLPRASSRETIRELVPAALKVENVALIELPKNNNSSALPTLSALVMLASDTPISEVDAAVSALQTRYLGFGCYLKISRHVSLSSDHGPMANAAGNISEIQPFGAKQMSSRPVGGSLRSAPPPSSYGNHPPPSSYIPTGPNQSQRVPGLMQVSVVPPSDVKQLKLIHRTAESLIAYGPDFEALLVSRPEVQRDEKWAWFFDATSQGGIYYRWTVWKHMTEDVEVWDDEAASYTDVSGGPGGTDRVFDSGPLWLPPQERPRFEHITEFEELVENDEYVSSDDESGDEGERRQYNSGHAPDMPSIEDPASDSQARYLNPYRRAKLTHLLARLPESIAMLRMGDVARVTSFVVNNAGQGAEEIVDMLLTNIEHPFRYSVHYNTENDPQDLPRTNSTDPPSPKHDASAAQLIGLYLLSDSMQASSTSGLRDAWKYRALFESALSGRQIFERLGRLDKELAWGRMRAEQWRRKVGGVLALWEARGVFPADAQEGFRKRFLEPPLSEREKREKEEEERRGGEEREKARWRSAEQAAETARGQNEQGVAQTTVPATAATIIAGSEANDDKRKAAAEKIAAMKAKVQAEAQARASESEKHSLPEEQQKSDSRAARRARPTAADLNDAQASEQTAKVSAPSPAVKMTGFGFSMSLGGGGAARSASPAGAGVGSATSEEREREGRDDGKGVSGDMFSASDEE